MTRKFINPKQNAKNLQNKADESENQPHHRVESSYEGVIESKEVQVLPH